VRANLPEELRRTQVRVLGDTPPAGHEAQVDYGRLGMWTDPGTGKRVTVWAFVMVLSHSRHMFVRPVVRMDQRAWSEAHVEAFRFFGGVPARIVPDNLATGVERADLYDPKLNRGDILAPGDPVYDKFVGKPDPATSTSRFPVLYLADPLDGGVCRCGCGQPVARGDWVQGHDQRAIHDRIRADFGGSVSRFIDWYDSQRACAEPDQVT
jgi:hypothetical protein